MIEADGRDRNNGQDRGRDAGGNHPRRKWAVDQALHSSPAGEKRVGPESNRRQVITVDRPADHLDRKSTRLNSSHTVISYAVFCLKKKKPQHGGDAERRLAPPSTADTDST